MKKIGTFPKNQLSLVEKFFNEHNVGQYNIKFRDMRFDLYVENPEDVAKAALIACFAAQAVLATIKDVERIFT